MEIQPNKIKVVSIDAKMMAEVFNWWLNPPTFICLPVTEELPEGTIVVSVHTDWSRRTLDAIVFHPTFDEVPVGVQPPMVASLVTEFRTFRFPADPELLKSTMSLLEVCERYLGPMLAGDEMTQARAAIAKARGND